LIGSDIFLENIFLAFAIESKIYIENNLNKSMSSWISWPSFYNYNLFLFVLVCYFPSRVNVVLNVFMCRNDCFNLMTARNPTFLIIFASTNYQVIFNYELIFVDLPVIFIVIYHHGQAANIIPKKSFKYCLTNCISEQFQLSPAKNLLIWSCTQFVLCAFFRERFNYFEELS
jgi:hypothetical protein